MEPHLKPTATEATQAKLVYIEAEKSRFCQTEQFYSLSIHFTERSFPLEEDTALSKPVKPVSGLEGRARI